MKRLTLLTILLVVVGLTAGFALELKPSFELTGEASVSWGIDLADFSTGFLNDASADLTLNLFAEDTEDTKKGDGDWYGSITLSNIEVWFVADEGAAGALSGDMEALSVEAKIVGLGGNLAIGVFDAPDTYLDFVTAIEDEYDTGDPDDDDPVVDEDTDGVGVGYDGYGTYVSYNVSEALMVGLEVVSEYDHLLNNAQAYAFALDVEAKFAPLTINAGVNYGFNYALQPNVLGAGIKVAADTDMIDAWVGFDAQVTGGFAFDVGAGVTATLVEGVTADLGIVYGDAYDDIDVKFVFTEPGDAGLVDGLDASLTVYVLDILDDVVEVLEYEVIFEAGYQMGKLYPHFGVTYGDPNDGAAFLEAFVHCDYDLFEAAPTTLFVEWNSDNLLASALGEFIVGVKVEY